MERNQIINCTVTSCKYNNRDDQACNLEEIIVTPVTENESKLPDESMCSSYENIDVTDLKD